MQKTAMKNFAKLCLALTIKFLLPEVEILFLLAVTLEKVYCMTSCRPWYWKLWPNIRNDHATFEEISNIEGQSKILK